MGCGEGGSMHMRDSRSVGRCVVYVKEGYGKVWDAW